MVGLCLKRVHRALSERLCRGRSVAVELVQVRDTVSVLFCGRRGARGALVSAIAPVFDAGLCYHRLAGLDGCYAPSCVGMCDVMEMFGFKVKFRKKAHAIRSRELLFRAGFRNAKLTIT